MSEKPFIFNVLRRIIEFNFIEIKRTIKKELFLNGRNDTGRILDVPCGTGEFCRLFDKGSYSGIDISDRYIDYAIRACPGYSFYCRDAKDTGFSASSFDIVMIIGFFHQLENRKIKTILDEFKRILKQDGRVLLIKDAPVSSKWNLVGRLLQRYDAGIKIRPIGDYADVLRDRFKIIKSYPIRNGFWNYNVFLMSNK